jgi:hypothetical protein
MKFLTYPPFRAQATVRIWIYDAEALGSGFNNSPSASINTECYVKHTGDLDYLRTTAESILLRFGASPDILKTAYFEWTVTKYIATEPRGVRRKPEDSYWDREPVEAFTEYQLPELGEKRAARIKLLVKQRRFVPDSQAEMLRLYNPTPAVVANNQAVPA